MMPYYYWNGHMNGGWSFLAFIIWAVLLADLVLLGIWLYSKLRPHK